MKINRERKLKDWYRHHTWSDTVLKGFKIKNFNPSLTGLMNINISWFHTIYNLSFFKKFSKLEALREYAPKIFLFNELLK